MATMSIGAALLALALILTLGKQTGPELSRAFRSPSGRQLFSVSLVLTAVLALSLVVALVFPLRIGEHGPTVHFIKDLAKVWYLFWPLVLFLALNHLRKDERETVLRTWIIVFGVLSAVGVLQFFIGWPRPQVIPGNESHFHTTIFLGHHLSVASVFIFPFFVVLDLIATKVNDSRLGFSRGMLFAIAGVGLLALFGTYSRMLWLALPIGLLVWAYSALRGKGKLRVYGLVLLIAALGIGSQLPAVQQRIHATMGVSERQELWKTNFEFLKQRPITGVGFRHNEELSYYFLQQRSNGQYFFSGHAHNNLIDLLGGAGILGALAWIAWWWVVLSIGFRASRFPESLFVRGILCAILVFHLNGLTQVNFWEGKVQHQLSWMLAWLLLWAESRSENRVQT